nr:uncharacterized protein LOC123283888 [Equus asinus]
MNLEEGEVYYHLKGDVEPRQYRPGQLRGRRGSEVSPSARGRVRGSARRAQPASDPDDGGGANGATAHRLPFRTRGRPCLPLGSATAPAATGRAGQSGRRARSSASPLLLRFGRGRGDPEDHRAERAGPRGEDTAGAPSRGGGDRPWTVVGEGAERCCCCYLRARKPSRRRQPLENNPQSPGLVFLNLAGLSLSGQPLPPFTALASQRRARHFSNPFPAANQHRAVHSSPDRF